jgi:hypothetical protein
MTLWYWAKSLEAHYDRSGRMRLSTLLSSHGHQTSHEDEKASLRLPIEPETPLETPQIRALDDDEVDISEKGIDELGSARTQRPEDKELFLAVKPGPLPLARLPVVTLFHKPAGGKGGRFQNLINQSKINHN